MVSVGSVSAGSVSLDEDRVLVFELVRATEAAAVAAARFLGRGDRGEVDAAAVDAMRPVLGTIPMRGVVVIGKGEKEHDPMLHGGEQVGSGVGPAVDIAIDPVDGAGLTAKSLPNAMSVIAVADQGAMFDPGRCVYMDKLVVGADLADLVDFDAPIEDTLAAIARARGSSVAEVTVALLERPRHEELVRRLRAVGARIRFLVAGDVAGALMALLPESEVDVLVGVGGSPEGIVAACAAACMGGRHLRAATSPQRAGTAGGRGPGSGRVPGAHHHRPGSRPEHLLRGHRGDRWGCPSGCSVLGRPGGEPVPGDAVPHRCGAVDRSQAPVEHLAHRDAAGLSGP